MISRLEQALGALLILLTLSDIFLTVLYARMGFSIVSERLSRWLWRLFRLACRPLGKHHDLFLSFCGPVTIVVVIGLWVVALSVGAALIMHPSLGTSIVASSGKTSTDFVTALYAGGSSMSIVGAAGYVPRTSGYKLFYLFSSFVGISLITLAMAYLLQVYQALRQRNVFGLKLHLATGETGDAAELLAGLGAGGRFEPGYATFTDAAVELVRIKEAHHLYPVMLYFRFPGTYYAMVRCALVSLDTVTLIKSALDDKEYAWLKESAAVEQLWSAALRLVTAREQSAAPEKEPEEDRPADERTRERWERRYEGALRRLRDAGVATLADERDGRNTYVELRERWDGRIRVLADAMAYDMDDLDPAGSRPESIDRRGDFENRLRSV